eukprot:gene14050-5033_t
MVLQYRVWLSLKRKGKCNSPLGMEDLSIKDSQVTAKSWLYFKRRDSRHYRPYFARINHEKLSGGWCSADLKKYPEPYVEVDLMGNTRVTGIATQGRHNGQEWVEFFKIEYKRNNETSYRKYKEQGTWKVFKGNIDTNSTVKHIFSRPIILQQIRIIPIGSRFTIHCMRLELYGCAWTQERDGLVSYSGPLGEIRKGISLQDDTYDGYTPLETSGMLFGGIGKLTDGVVPAKGPAYESRTNLYTEWVGYKSNPIVLFTFNNSRKFNSISFHVLNKNNFKLFEKVSVEVSGDSVEFISTGNFYPTAQGKNEQGILQIKVSLNGNIGRFLKCSFYLRRSWLLIGEIEFDSEPILAEKKEQIIPQVEILKTPDVADKSNDKDNGIPEDFGSYEESFENSSSSRNKNDGLSFPIILTIVLVGIVIVIALLVVIFRFVRSSRKSKRKQRETTSLAKDSRSRDELKEERVSLNGETL